MTTEKGNRKDKNQNIQVFVRLRPLNQRERDIRSLGVVEVVNGREVVVRQSQHTSHVKKFTFDRAFGPHAKQVEVYQDVVSPLIEEVLAGYNCTVFAYGQTGTGKTHTMVGESTSDETSWQNDPLAGIIPRALSQLFDELRLTNTEYTVRVSYLELYNEELFDLLSSSEDNSKLRIYEDVTRKGSNIVNGLEEITVYTKNEVYKIMAQGQERKKVASTLMNAQSSRSHTVFTIVVHMKENSPEGEELVKIGKLNLVDLAGSENISKAGSDNPAKKERARECVNINQSLLTLGRVITALVERHPHIPYRESKLTRILQESLGGRTKTSIIATVSPGHKDMEETMSTLEYAHRARNIQNKPEINQKMTKKAILKEYSEEIDRLKRDLQAARDKNGVYLANETFAELTLKQEEQRKEIQELLLQKRSVEEDRDRLEAVFGDASCRLRDREEQLGETMHKLDLVRDKLSNTKNILRTTAQNYEEQKHLVHKHAETEAKLSQQAGELVGVLDTATGHLSSLHNAFDKSRTLESLNMDLTNSFYEQSLQHQDKLKQEIDAFTKDLVETLNTIRQTLDNHLTGSEETHTGIKCTMEELTVKITDTVNKVKSMTANAQAQLTCLCDEKRQCLQNETSLQERATGVVCEQLELMQAKAVAQVEELAGEARTETSSAIDQWREKGRLVLVDLSREHGAFADLLRDNARCALEGARRECDARRMMRSQREQRMEQLYETILEQHRLQDHLLTLQQQEAEEDRQQTSASLDQWTELVARLAQDIAEKRTRDEARVAERMARIEEARRVQEESMRVIKAWRQAEMACSKEEGATDDGVLACHESSNAEKLQQVSLYDVQFEQGTTALRTDLASCHNVVIGILEQRYKQSVTKLQEVANETQGAVKNLTVSFKESCSRLNDGIKITLSEVLDTHRNISNAALSDLESLDAMCSKDLTAVVATTTDLIKISKKNHSTLNTELLKASSSTNEHYKGVHDSIERHEQLERKYLQQEYKKYVPTGGTPVRNEYRCARQLAATSPYDRILARFRAARALPSDEVIVIESEQNTSQSSDSDSMVSEDSVNVFTVPSPPGNVATATVNGNVTPAHHAVVGNVTNGYIDRTPNVANRSDLSVGSQNGVGEPTPAKMFKSTSESDICYKKGKENLERSASTRGKVSKLPAPAPASKLPAPSLCSTKKPLADRNNIE